MQITVKIIRNLRKIQMKLHYNNLFDLFLKIFNTNINEK